MTMPRRVAGGVRPVDRREFLACCAGALAVIGLGGCAALVTRTVYPVNGRLELPLTLYPELLERGGQLRLRPEGHSEEIYVLALPDSGFAALSPVCTHLGCIVDIEGERLVCPCHGSTYDRTGAVLQGPAELALRRYPSRLGEDGVLIIDLRSQA